MKIIQEMDFSEFEPWSGAEDTYKRICECNKESEMESFIEEQFPDGCLDTELNDLLWFESDFIYETLGIAEEDEEEERLSEIGQTYRVIGVNLDFPYNSIVIALEGDDSNPYCVLSETYERVGYFNLEAYEDDEYHAIEMEDLEEY